MLSIQIDFTIEVVAEEVMCAFAREDKAGDGADWEI